MSTATTSTQKVLTTGNEAAAEAAIRAGCRFYYGYPITPQNEITGYMAAHMPAAGGVFIQAESELAAISMCYGTSATGRRVMTSSSSPGISLKQEGISYMTGAELPVVIINVQRGGPGLGDISPAQGDYFQSTKGGGHGDYRVIVLAPHNVQEMYDYVMNAFDLADLYRNPVLILSDGQLGQMMEPMVMKPYVARAGIPSKESWVLTGAEGRPQHIVKSFFLRAGDLVAHNTKLQAKFHRIEENEVRCEEIGVEGAQIILVAYGTSARVCLDAMRTAEKEGLKMGLIRPITLWPYPTAIIRKRAEEGYPILVVEMSAGQMIEDVRLAVEGRTPVGFCGRAGGGSPEPAEVIAKAKEMLVRSVRPVRPVRQVRQAGGA